MPSGPRSPFLAAAGGPAHLITLGLTLLTLALAPIAVGTVHRPVMLLVSCLALASFTALAVTTWSTGRGFRGVRYCSPLVLLAGLPLLQLIPLPMGLRGIIDPRGNDLLLNVPPPAFPRFPLSLDPSTTQIELLRAAAASIVFLVCLNLSSGRRGHGPTILKVIAASAVFGVLIAMGHPLLNFDRVYDAWGPGGSATLVGPFVNPNHTAQFFELGAFVALACAFLTQDRLVRFGWTGAAALCGAAALLTLSRGSLIGLVAGALALTPLLVTRGQDGQSPHRARFRWALPAGLGMAGLVAGLSIALGALPIIDEIARTRVTQPGEKTDVWWDALKVLWAHPAGIGRGAFDRVYPAYRALPDYVRQNFVENEPLQLLIDLGWAGFAAFVASVVYVSLILRRRRLRDGAEAAMIAALVAVVAHNVFDFGLETLGLRLPFVAVAGVMFGRLLGGRRAPTAAASRAWLPASVALAAFGLGFVGLASAKPFDLLLQDARGAERSKIAVEAARTHPTDYYFPLVQASSEPLRLKGRSPRLAALTRAMRLCPNCADVHRATASELWQLGREGQALGEYRLAMDLEPARVFTTLEDLYKRGATPEQVASLRTTVRSVALNVAGSIVHRQGKGAAPRLAIEHARSLGADAFELGLLQVHLAFTESNNQLAAEHIANLINMNPRSASALYLQALLQDRQGDAKSALDTATVGAGYNPNDLSLARLRLQLATRLEAWGDFERGLEGLKHALYEANGTVAEAYFFSAQANRQRGNLPRAMGDYQTAVNIEPQNASAWYELGATAEQGGFLTQAVDAFRGVLQVQPDHAAAKAGLARIEALRDRSNHEALIRGPTRP